MVLEFQRKSKKIFLTCLHTTAWDRFGVKGTTNSNQKKKLAEDLGGNLFQYSFRGW
jgi:hypothetical protein